AWEHAAEPEGYRLAGVALDDVAAVKKMTKLWGDEAGRATKSDRILVLGATEAGRRRALAAAPLDLDWTWPPRALRVLAHAEKQEVYHGSVLAAMDLLFLWNGDH